MAICWTLYLLDTYWKLYVSCCMKTWHVSHHSQQLHNSALSFFTLEVGVRRAPPQKWLRHVTRIEKLLHMQRIKGWVQKARRGGKENVFLWHVKWCGCLLLEWSHDLWFPWTWQQPHNEVIQLTHANTPIKDFRFGCSCISDIKLHQLRWATSYVSCCMKTWHVAHHSQQLHSSALSFFHSWSWGSSRTSPFHMTKLSALPNKHLWTHSACTAIWWGLQSDPWLPETCSLKGLTEMPHVLATAWNPCLPRTDTVSGSQRWL